MLYTEIMDTLNERIMECEGAIDHPLTSMDMMHVLVSRRDALMAARRLLQSLDQPTERTHP